ncbi:hypothetical protein B0H13DRAFT_2363190 [Mycena leptocephala]|nr:hypothetical protein B0H13DRAFT_2363190 [Mycena leptocephala]
MCTLFDIYHQAPLVVPLEAPQVDWMWDKKILGHARRHRGMATSHPLQNTFSTPSRGSLSSLGCWIKNAPTRAPSSQDGDFSPPHRMLLELLLDGP